MWGAKTVSELLVVFSPEPRKLGSGVCRCGWQALVQEGSGRFRKALEGSGRPWKVLEIWKGSGLPGKVPEDFDAVLSAAGFGRVSEGSVPVLIESAGFQGVVVGQLRWISDSSVLYPS